MADDLSFHLEVLAPDGLGSIEPYLSGCTLPLEAWRSGFNGQVILRQSDDVGFEFSMDPSKTEVLHASGFFEGDGEHDSEYDVDAAWSGLVSLSLALERAGYPHWIGLDVANTLRTVSFRCDLLTGRRWVTR